MCTVFFLESLGLLSKNRDKEFTTLEEVFKTDDVLAVRSVGADYFSLAINRHGVAFVSTAINSPAWNLAVMTGRPDEARSIEAQERRGLSSPTKAISTLLPSAQTKAPLVARLIEDKSAWLGYNVILADAQGAVVVEVHADQKSVRPLAERDAVTNHFRDLGQFGPRQEADYPSTFDRLKYARENLGRIGSLSDLQRTLRPDDSKAADRIWRTGAFHTVSVGILDLHAKALIYASGREGPFSRYTVAN